MNGPLSRWKKIKIKSCSFNVSNKINKTLARRIGRKENIQITNIKMKHDVTIVSIDIKKIKEYYEYIYAYKSTT